MATKTKNLIKSMKPRRPRGLSSPGSWDPENPPGVADLLLRLAREEDDAGYRLLPERRKNQPDQGRIRNRWSVVPAIILVGFGLGVALNQVLLWASQVRQVIPEISEQISERQLEVNELNRQILAVEKSIDNRTGALLEGNSAQLAAYRDEVSSAAGFSEVTGSGLVVTVYEIGRASCMERV